MKRILFLCTLLIFFGCLSDSDEKISSGQLLTAPAYITLDSVSLSMDAIAWENRMPSTDPGGYPLYVTASLKTDAAAGDRLSGEFEAERIYIVSENGDIWDEEALSADKAPGALITWFAEGTARDWMLQENLRIDAVLEFNYDGKTILIRNPDLEIGAAY